VTSDIKIKNPMERSHRVLERRRVQLWGLKKLLSIKPMPQEYESFLDETLFLPEKSLRNLEYHDHVVALPRSFTDFLDPLRGLDGREPREY
jgi:hypothetical protein